jgi:hypothetical protein
VTLIERHSPASGAAIARALMHLNSSLAGIRQFPC